MDINSVCLIGRLTRDVEIRTTQSGHTIGKFTLAQNVKRKGQEESHFFDCVLFGEIVGKIGQYMTRGKQVAIQGSLQQEKWEKDGQQRSKITVNARDIQLLGGGDRSEPNRQAQAETYDGVPF